jgi:hypothetical protein
MATRTAWAHTAQSMPSVFSSTLRNSADAATGIVSAMSAADVMRSNRFIRSSAPYFVQKK